MQSAELLQRGAEMLHTIDDRHNQVIPSHRIRASGEPPCIDVHRGSIAIPCRIADSLRSRCAVW